MSHLTQFTSHVASAGAAATSHKYVAGQYFIKLYNFESVPMYVGVADLPSPHHHPLFKIMGSFLVNPKYLSIVRKGWVSYRIVP